MLKFDKNTTKFKAKYCLWKSYPNFSLSSSLYFKNDKLFISSFDDLGILVIDDAKQKLQSLKQPD